MVNVTRERERGGEERRLPAERKIKVENGRKKPGRST